MHTKSQDSISDIQRNLSPFRAGWSLMSHKEKIASVWIAIGIVLVGLIDAAALTSVLPVIHLITEPGSLQKPSLLRDLYVYFNEPPIRSFFPALAGVSLLLLTCSTLLRMWSEYITQKLSSQCQTRLAEELLEGVLSADYDWSLRQSPTKLTRLVQNDVSLWANSFVRRLGVVTNAAITALVAVGLVLIYSPWQITVVLVSIAVLVWLALQASKGSIGRLSIVHREATERVAMVSHQSISGLKDVKMTNKESAMTSLLVIALTRYGKALTVNNSLRQIPSNLLMYLGQASIIGVALMLWWIGTSSGEIASQVALLAMASSRMIPAMNRLSAGAGVLWDAMPYMKGIVALKAEVEAASRDVNIREKSATPENWSAITFRNVSYQYPNAGQAAIRNLCLELKPGRSYGIVGPSGAGKSTFVDLLAGLLSPTHGAIQIDMKTLDSFSAKDWRYGIGYVSQSPFLLDDTLSANVAFGERGDAIDDTLVWECLRKAHLEDVTLSLEAGLATELGDRGLRLSGGQRQRIAIARALYQRPKILVLDEATSALDGISEAAIQQTLSELHGEITIITVAHRLTTVRDADEIFVLDNGELVTRGSYPELLKTSHLFRRLAFEDHAQS